MRKKLAAALLGLVFVLLTLEGALRLIGALEARRSSGEVAGAGSIVCFGNSYTAGVGAPPGQSYCDHLQRLIDKAGWKYKVVNRGAAFTNTYNVLMAIRRELREEKPGLVLIMTGEQNYANYEGYARFLKKSAPEAASGGLLAGLEMHRLLRAPRLLQLLFRDWEKPSGAKMSRYFPETPLADTAALGFKWMGALHGGTVTLAALDPATRKEAIDAMTELSRRPEGGRSRLLALTLARASGVARDPRAARASGVARDPRAAGAAGGPGPAPSSRELREALSPAAKARAYDGPDPAGQYRRTARACAPSPENADCAILLSVLLERQGRKTEALAPLFTAITEDPFGGGQRALDRLVRYRATLPADAEVQREVREFLAGLRLRFPGEVILETADPSSIPAWMESDLREMAGLLRSRGVPFLFQTYPPTRAGAGRPADSLLRSLARREGYPLSDTHEYFAMLFASGIDRAPFYSDEYGTNDDHLSALGNARLAEFLFSSISEHGLWPK